MKIAIIINSMVLIGLSILLSLVTHNLFFRLSGTRVMNKTISRRIYKAFGLIGTPLHELSHLIMSLVFGHRIVSVDLFGFRGTAQVQHAYNSRSTYQLVGNFFIAIAPLIFSILTIKLLLLTDLNMNVYLASNPFESFKVVLMDVPRLLVGIVSATEAWRLVVAGLVCFYCVPSNTDFIIAARGSVYACAIVVIILSSVLLLTGVDAMANFVGTIVVAATLSSCISVVGWVFLLILSLLGQLSTKSVGN